MNPLWLFVIVPFAALAGAFAIALACVAGNNKHPLDDEEQAAFLRQYAENQR